MNKRKNIHMHFHETVPTRDLHIKERLVVLEPMLD